MKILQALFFCSLFLSFSVSAQTIDAGASKVAFEVRNLKINTVTGSFGNLTGTAAFNPENLESSRFEACVDASTVHTGNKKRDDHLLTEDFFNSATYPTICFTSLAVSKTSLGYVTRGELQLLDTTREIYIPFTYDNGVIKGQFTINRLEFGLGADTGTFVIGDEVTLMVECVVG